MKKIKLLFEYLFNAYKQWKFDTTEYPELREKFIKAVNYVPNKKNKKKYMKIVPSLKSDLTVEEIIKNAK